MEIMIGIEESIRETGIDKLVEAGATEFFCGIIPRDWSSVYDYQISLNKREWGPNQFHGFGTLAVAARKVHSLKKKIAVTFNTHYYTREQVPLIEKYLGNLQDIGVDALIVGNIPFLLMLRSMGITIPVYISGEMGVYNYRSLMLCQKFGVKRILFPRDMSTDEMAGIIKKSAGLGLEFEAFAMSERCVFSAGYCRTSHGYSNINFCNQGWKKELNLRLPENYSDMIDAAGPGSVDGIIPKPTLKLVKDWNINTSQYRAFTNCHFYPAFASKMTFWGGCGLCSVTKLRDIGITSLKIVSRGTKLDTKLMRIKIVCDVLKNGTAGADFPMKIKDTRELCELGYACYYRETRGKNG